MGLIPRAAGADFLSLPQPVLAGLYSSAPRSGTGESVRDKVADDRRDSRSDTCKAFFSSFSSTQERPAT